MAKYGFSFEAEAPALVPKGRETGLRDDHLHSAASLVLTTPSLYNKHRTNKLEIAYYRTV